VLRPYPQHFCTAFRATLFLAWHTTLVRQAGFTPVADTFSTFTHCVQAFLSGHIDNLLFLTYPVM
jgi:hypothetical protein